MTRGAAFVVFLATCMTLCQAAPLNNGGRRAFNSSGTSAPLPSATQQNTTSTSSPTSSTSVPNWAAYPTGTTGYALNQLLSNSIGAGFPQRWAVAEIAPTQIGLSDPAGSNADLSKAVDTVFAESSNYSTWVETYIEFLREASANFILTDAENKTLYDYISAAEPWAAAQVKLVRAYEAAHPGNVTYVGVDVTNVAKINGTTMVQMEDWAHRGGDANCTSNTGGNSTSSSNQTYPSNGTTSCTFDRDGPYTTDDYSAYLTAASTYFSLQGEVFGPDEIQEMASRYFALKDISQFGIFNLSMDIGGNGTYMQFAPAWTATVSSYAWSGSSGLQILGSNLQKGLSDSTSNTTSDPSPIKRSGIAATDQSTQGFGSLQFIAHGTNSTTAQTGSVRLAAPMSALAANTDPLDQAMLDGQSFALLTLQEGSWADDRDTYIQVARKNSPAIADKYFGPGSSGSGPIGRILYFSYDPTRPTGPRK
ncbi:hypothetical protein C8R44DRAFT_847431 [Mycena epipterygia]|nr:hypothetical protein C8R44DRAFT_847431 [Mycena epipterygia]